jgi:two-component system OmpR family sensor kinase
VEINTFRPTPGKSTQEVNNAQWHVFTVVQADRCIQVAQPTSARREGAIETATRLLLSLALLIALIGAVSPSALRRGLRPLTFANDALALRNAQSVEPLGLRGVPTGIMPIVRTLNDLLRRLDAAFATQRHFVADAAHELRSPVTALQLQVQLLEGSQEPVGRSLGIAELATGIRRTRRLIEQFLYLSHALLAPF